MNIAIRNGRVISPANHMDAVVDVAIIDGKIHHIGALPSDFTPDKTLDAKGKWVTPGIVDIFCHPQLPEGGFAHEANNALKRGVTTLCIPPDIGPILDSPAQIALLPNDAALPHIYPIGALTLSLQGEILTDLGALSKHCIAFSNGANATPHLSVLKHCYAYAAMHDHLCIIQAQDGSLGQGVAHDGIIATRLGLKGIPETAETVAIAQHLLLIEATGVRAHFTGLSSARGVAQIHEAKAQGLRVSADTAMHSLHLTEMDLNDFNANCHVYPPLRSIRDQQGLLMGINDRTIDAICSDHRPLPSLAKLAPFSETLPGMSTLDTFLSLGLHLVAQQKISASRLIEAITSAPCAIFRLPHGTLSIGAPADITIIDPAAHWEVNNNSLTSLGKNSAFMHWELPGRVVATLLHGTIVYGAP